MTPGKESGQPVIILEQGTERTRGAPARDDNIRAATAVADIVRSTLGPKGMDKMLVESSGDVVVTNDGATIMKQMDVAHPAAKMLTEIALAQDSECGDGTKSSVILAGELLKEAAKLLDEGVHANIIEAGYMAARREALDVLDAIAIPLGVQEDRLKDIAATSLYSKNVAPHAELIAAIAVEACTQVAGDSPDIDLDNVLVKKAMGGAIEDTSLVRGVILEKERIHKAMPHHVGAASIALLASALEVKKTAVREEIRIREPGQIEAFVAQEQKGLRDMVAKIQASGANVLVCQAGVADIARYELAKAGIYAVAQVGRSDMAKLAKATSGTIVTTLDDLVTAVLGKAGLVEERCIDEQKFTVIADCASPRAVSILVRGSTQHLLDEAERALHDALSVVAGAMKDGKMLPGGGAAFMEAAMHVRDHAATVGGRQQLAIDAYANALESIPKALVENAGLDGLDVLLSLRQAHKNGDTTAGLNAFNGSTEDMLANRIVEPLRVTKQVLQGATETAIMILRIDDVIAAKPFADPGATPGGPGDE